MISRSTSRTAVSATSVPAHTNPDTSNVHSSGRHAATGTPYALTGARRAGDADSGDCRRSLPPPTRDAGRRPTGPGRAAGGRRSTVLTTPSRGNTPLLDRHSSPSRPVTAPRAARWYRSPAGRESASPGLVAVAGPHRLRRPRRLVPSGAKQRVGQRPTGGEQRRRRPRRPRASRCSCGPVSSTTGTPHPASSARNRSVIQARRCSPSRSPSSSKGTPPWSVSRYSAGRRAAGPDPRRGAAEVALLPDRGGPRVGVAEQQRPRRPGGRVLGGLLLADHLDEVVPVPGHVEDRRSGRVERSRASLRAVSSRPYSGTHSCPDPAACRSARRARRPSWWCRSTRRRPRPPGGRTRPHRRAQRPPVADRVRAHGGAGDRHALPVRVDRHVTASKRRASSAPYASEEKTASTGRADRRRGTPRSARPRPPGRRSPPGWSSYRPTKRPTGCAACTSRSQSSRSVERDRLARATAPPRR